MRVRHQAGMLLFAAGLLVTGCRASTANRWLLVYDGDPRFTTYDRAAYETLIGQRTCDRAPFDGVILLALQSPRGRWFMNWEPWAREAGEATVEDWGAYLHTLTAADGVLRRIEQAAETANRRTRLEVAIMLPYLHPDGDAERPSEDRRIDVYRRMVPHLQETVRRQQLRHVAFAGVYWLYEDLPASDTLLVQRVASLVHERGLQFFWIPYFRAQNVAGWRRFGFDRVWLQPNYYFDRRIAETRMDSARSLASRAGVGLELELDDRALTDPTFASRVLPYIQVIGDSSPLAVYDGAGAIMRLFGMPAHARPAPALFDFLCARHSPVAAGAVKPF